MLPKEGYAVFDFDNTCIINDIQEATLSFLCENSLLKNLDGKATFQKYHQLLENGQTQKAYEFGVTSLAGFSVDEIRKIVREMIASEGSKITKRDLFGIKINKGIKRNEPIFKLIDSLHRKKYEIYVVSASSKFVVEEAIKVFLPNYGIKCIGLENVIDKGILTEKLIHPISMFGGKVDCIKKYISKDKRPILAAGDSMNDKEMLEYSGVKVVVDRNNQLTDIARKKDWIILPKGD